MGELEGFGLGGGHQQVAALGAQGLQQLEHARQGPVAGDEHQQREAGLHQGHRAVQQLGAGHGLGVQGAGLLELERELVGDGEGVAAPHHQGVVALGQGLEPGAPVGLGGSVHGLGEQGEGVLEALVVGPVGHELGQGGQGRQVALGRGHRLLGLGPQRQHHLAGPGERRGLLVDEGHRERPAAAGLAGDLEQVRALPRLRDGDDEGLVEREAGPVDRGDRGGGAGDHHAQQALEQVLAVERGVVGAAAGDGEGEGRGVAAQVARQRLDLAAVLAQQAFNYGGRLERLAVHLGFVGPGHRLLRPPDRR
ncbi:hypothetical protein Mterra_03849 [Calidithermus terrae]|uniref:Uncharacterized protein n=1 Tax=Calidithermus terrae TaxID=1408545 RepID=A0A399E3A0_9DEIN|nr:hypothetical protein Mterra_03849 [Calidithermus terrae]